MHELRPEEYARAGPVLSKLEDHLAVVALVQGTAPGRLFVDDAAHPGVALAWIQQRFYLAGSNIDDSVNEDLRRLFLEVVFSKLVAAGRAMFVLSYDDERWLPTIEDRILRDRALVRAARRYYAFDVDRSHHPTAPAEGLLRSVDKAFLDELPVQDREALVEEMCSERPSAEAFLRKSFGLAAIRRGRLAGWCLSEYNTGQRCEVGIATMEPYRRRGLATAMASAFIEQARSRGVRHIGWHCHANNVASAATALKAGFEHVMDHSVHLVWLSEAGEHERA